MTMKKMKARMGARLRERLNLQRSHPLKSCGNEQVVEKKIMLDFKENMDKMVKDLSKKEQLSKQISALTTEVKKKLEN